MAKKDNLCCQNVAGLHFAGYCKFHWKAKKKKKNTLWYGTQCMYPNQNAREGLCTNATVTASQLYCEHHNGQDFRATSLPAAGTIWGKRDGLDKYTGKAEPETKDPERDHIIECQMANAAWARTVADMDPKDERKEEVQRARLRLMAVHNSVENLNMTARELNGRKKDPVMAFLKASTASSGKPLGAFKPDTIEYEVWERILGEMRAAYGRVKRQVDADARALDDDDFVADVMRCWLAHLGELVP